MTKMLYLGPSLERQEKVKAVVITTNVNPMTITIEKKAFVLEVEPNDDNMEI